MCVYIYIYIYVYVYIYIYMYMCIYIYVYIYAPLPVEKRDIWDRFRLCPLKKKVDVIHGKASVSREVHLYFHRMILIRLCRLEDLQAGTCGRNHTSFVEWTLWCGRGVFLLLFFFFCNQFLCEHLTLMLNCRFVFSLQCVLAYLLE